MNIVKKIRMICTNVDANNNKFWEATLYDNDTFNVLYGRVGYSGTEEGPFPGGEKALNKKISEKKKKGYTEFTGLAVGQNKQEIVQENLQEVAKKQIQYTNPILEKLIQRLVQSNIHNIVSNTNIKYDIKSGLFSTPLGIITIESINKARNLLALLKHDMDKKVLAEYLMLVPHDLGMSKVSSFIDSFSFDKELNILDSLEASFQTVQTSKPVENENKDVPKIFEVKLSFVDQKDSQYSLIEEWYESSKKRMHGYDNVKIANIYEVSISSMDQAFTEKGVKYGNIEKVFHGTSEANLLSILKSGLKVSPPSTAYIAGKMFGNGVYGAKESSKALGYTFGRWGGSVAQSGWLFVCNFAMGKTYDPNHSGSPPSGYDSTWAKAKKCGLYHDELIVYKNEQIQITHLLECKR